ncbi:MAG: Rieske 2Fe-2S domain-containing protein [Firmicutes bacterium]|nr:Rieske 2Fe-2S domain-containing protein [Alicyclobacillaceae bacterium]MCL6496568.1 Rieske 2Fe-2S domain-containing protein [Bacillota bacterium]
MLSAEENALLTEVGPGTPMGEFMRAYWIPALLSSELPHPDCDPVRVMLLGERLIAFRDSAGRVGLIQNHCPHRGASLFYGRNEAGGLRCVYHGWKFDVAGRCLDMPNEPPESDFKHKLRARAYPCVERGGVVWAYLGRAEPPPLPDLPANQLPEGEAEVWAVQHACNWLQALEGDVDTSHLGFLHLGSLMPEEVTPDTFLYWSVADRAPRYEVVDTEYGLTYGAWRPAGPGRRYWRVAQFLFPFYSQAPAGILGQHVGTHALVPMDDHHTLRIMMHQRQAERRPIQGRSERLPSVHTELLPNTSDWYGRFVPRANGENDYLLDRKVQRQGLTYSGIWDVRVQDNMVTESMGPIYDRTAEHLAVSDVAVIRMRRRLLQAVRAFAAGRPAPGVDHPEWYRVAAGGVVLAEGEKWLTYAEAAGRRLGASAATTSPERG